MLQHAAAAELRTVCRKLQVIVTRQIPPQVQVQSRDQRPGWPGTLLRTQTHAATMATLLSGSVPLRTLMINI